jgi:hypothetical protein
MKKMYSLPVVAPVISVALAWLTAAVSIAPAYSLPADAGDKGDKNTVDVLVLNQTALQTGPMNMVVSKQAVKFTLDKMGICWLARGPKWQSHAFNPESKTILVRDYAVWKNGFFEVPHKKSEKKEAELKLRETGSHEKVAGYNCRKADLMRIPSAPFKPGEPQKPYKAGVVWIAEKFPAPKELTEVMKNLVKVDVKEGLVLRFKILKPGSFKDMHLAYDTIKVTESKKPASYFEPPVGYKVVKSEMQLLMGDSEDEPDMDFLKKKS